jgi:hypothetical protein
MRKIEVPARRTLSGPAAGLIAGGGVAAEVIKPCAAAVVHGRQRGPD